MARTYGYALAGALLATFTITPVLASYMIPESVSEVETFVVRVLRRVYTPILHWSLAHRWTMVGAGVAFLAVIALLVPRLGTEFLPALEPPFGQVEPHARSCYWPRSPLIRRRVPAAQALANWLECEYCEHDELAAVKHYGQAIVPGLIVALNQGLACRP
jgi:hypothetical protein